MGRPKPVNFFMIYNGPEISNKGICIVKQMPYNKYPRYIEDYFFHGCPGGGVGGLPPSSCVCGPSGVGFGLFQGSSLPGSSSSSSSSWPCSLGFGGFRPGSNAGLCGPVPFFSFFLCGVDILLVFNFFDKISSIGRLQTGTKRKNT